MSRNGKVIVALSGGVDSSVAACLLREQGYECVGVFLRVGAAAQSEPCALEPATPSAPPRRLRHGCCSTSDALDARAVADRLGIPFYALNFEADFAGIVDYFIDEYAQARTPNPCVECNIRLKFGKLLRYADAIGAEFVATGHYARIVRDNAGDPRLARAANLAKDQSYVLFGIPRAALGRCLFPLGEFSDKREVRARAAELGLRVHDKPDSQEICFVPGNDYRALLAQHRPELLREGEFRDAQGTVVGHHEGVACYTIGQRRGLGLALGRPVYVTQLDVLSNAVTVGSAEDLLRGGLEAERVNWHVDPPGVGVRFTARCKIRHQHTPATAEAEVCADGALRAHFAQPQPAVTPGQASVFYDERERVIAGGWIRAALP